MSAGKFGAVIDLAVIQPAQVAHVVKQAGDQSEQCAFSAQACFLIVLPLVSDEQARERERDVERVLSIVIDGIDAQVAGHFAGEESLEMLERLVERLERKRGPGGTETES